MKNRRTTTDLRMYCVIKKTTYFVFLYYSPGHHVNNSEYPDTFLLWNLLHIKAEI
jgi:hypothetical protein